MTKSIINSLILGLAVFLLAGFVWGEFNSTMDRRAQLGEKEILNKERVEALESIDRLDAEYQARISEVADLAMFLPGEKGSEYIVSSIYAGAEQSGMILESIDISDANRSDESKSKYDVVGIKVSLHGDYENFLEMLDNLESSLKIYDIRNISVGAESGVGGLSINFEMDTYQLNLD
ncbi:MAG: type 4a pilus biogenesis protein PilO [Parcubacteria group bacterium]